MELTGWSEWMPPESLPSPTDHVLSVFVLVCVFVSPTAIIEPSGF